MTVPESAAVVGISGGTSGIGLATAIHFAKLGWKVAVCGRDSRRLEEATSQLLHADLGNPACFGKEVDVRDVSAVESFVHDVASRFGRIDVWVNSAGIAHLAPLEELTQDELASTWEINCRAIFSTTQTLFPIFRRQRSGVIINVSSMASVDPFPGFSLYGASKAWVNLFTKAVAAEGASFGFRAYAVCPGAVETPLLRRLFPDYPHEETLTPFQIANLIGELVDPECSRESGEAVFITPQAGTD